ncbi:MAG TPA: ATP-dependent 6-phosphofructokinase [Methylomirabilota bacterium]|nr:ATP-dependent 6-phosphofructokinase [Methylomirabilota bacterium]
MPPVRHLGVLTGGGDCPGMNAALRAVVKAATSHRGVRVTGFLDGFAGLTYDQSRPLDFDAVSGILVQGGTILGASNRHDPFRVRVEDKAGAREEDRSDAAMGTLARHGIDALVVIGGDGSLRIADRLADRGVPVVGIPKTIDNDVALTDASVGFDSARAIATEAVDRLHTTAASHHRVMVVEVMGRHAGWIALEAGLAGGGDVILIPEIPFGWDAVVRGIVERTERGRRFSIVVVAEGARCPDGLTVIQGRVEGRPEPVRLGGVGAVVTHELEARLDFEVRYVVLGHVQRGGPPTAFDRVLATRLGAVALDAALAGDFRRMVALRGDRVERVPIAEAVASPRLVDPAGERVQAARDIRTIFGDEPAA